MSNTKHEFLEREGLLNPRSERVVYPLFREHDFFDPLDLPQVRYEMLRMVRHDGSSVVEACKLFGFSREYFYRLDHTFRERGYVSLLGSPKGRRPLLAVNQEILGHIIHRKMAKPDITGEDLRNEILALYKVDCSRRTVERTIEKLGLSKGGLRTT